MRLHVVTLNLFNVVHALLVEVDLGKGRSPCPLPLQRVRS